MKFIKWFAGSLEDEKGIASFRRIYNWILIVLIAFLVTYHAWKSDLTTLVIYELIVLLVAGFLNTSVITADNILRFFNRNKGEQQPEPEPQKQTAEISGTLELKKTE